MGTTTATVLAQSIVNEGMQFDRGYRFYPSRIPAFAGMTVFLGFSK